MHDACRREKNRSEVARKGKRAFDRQPGPFDVLRVADNWNPGNLQSAADGAFDRRAVCLLLRSVAHSNPLRERFEKRIAHAFVRVPFYEHFFLAREHSNRDFPNDKIAGFRRAFSFAGQILCNR